MRRSSFTAVVALMSITDSAAGNAQPADCLTGSKLPCDERANEGTLKSVARLSQPRDIVGVPLNGRKKASQGMIRLPIVKRLCDVGKTICTLPVGLVYCAMTELRYER